MRRDDLIIFDMDGTLYDLDDVVRANYEMQVQFLLSKTGYNREQVEKYLDSNHIYPDIRRDSLSATELFAKEGYDIYEWSVFRESNFDVSSIKRDKAVNNAVLSEFKKISTLVLLSSNSYKTIEKVLTHLGCSITLFSKVLCSDNFSVGKAFSKGDAMSYIAKSFNISTQKLLSIGDRYKTDIEPMLRLGGKGILMHSPSILSKVLEDYKTCSLKTCRGYEYFDSL